MPSPPIETPPHTTPNRPCTPVVSMHRQACEGIGSVPMERTGHQPRMLASDPFVEVAQEAHSSAVVRPYVLRPPTTPPRLPRPPRPVARTADLPANPSTPPGYAFEQPYSYSRAVRQGMGPSTPESPSPRSRTRDTCFQRFERLPVLLFSQQTWAESCCAIMKEPLAELMEPVAVPAFETVHVFEYVHLKRWLLDSGNIKGAPMQFKNPVNTTWTPLQALRRVQLEPYARAPQL